MTPRVFTRPQFNRAPPEPRKARRRTPQWDPFSTAKSWLALGLAGGMVFPAALAYEVSAAAESSPPEMVRIPAGPFIFGSSEEDIRWAARTFFSESLEYYKDETPARKMALDAFFIDKTEVTMGQYKRYSESTGNPPPKYGENGKFNAKDQPVVGVSWREAAGFCAWAGKRLPTEPEWEKAARGPDGRYYPWGQTPDPVLANVRGKKDGFRYTAPAGSFPPGQSLFGVMDLAGNVWEWTADWYGPHPGNTMESDLFGETFKVIKGGSWFSNLDLARASVRGKALPENRKNYIGFRCARGADNPSTQ